MGGKQAQAIMRCVTKKQRTMNSLSKPEPQSIASVHLGRNSAVNSAANEMAKRAGQFEIDFDTGGFR